ncbi:MAG: PrsW family intramembrane metalloprotease [Spirochaetaceae bacterium]|jgi:RsiW-degrading membrane proteinase PrsW (M82 family)|nr:PrsW family intramembrane metalloprotease [Spirochaetaceae bacterium]
MNGFVSLALLVLMAALPVLVSYIWLRRKGWGILLFAAALLAGVLALITAVLLQSLFPPRTLLPGMWGIFFKLFIEIAGTEEGSRLVFLVLFLKLISRFPSSGAMDGNFKSDDFYFRSLASGLASGLGFAFMETISYAAADLGIALFRAFSAAPLHAACGIRAAFAADFIVRGRDEKGTGGGRNFIFAVIIHGMYNFLLINPGVPAFVPVMLAFISLIVPLLVWRAKSGPPA